MKRTYNTKQGQIILDIIETTKGSHFSVEDIYERIKNEDLSIGKATVYRHIKDLVEEGVLRKYAAEFGKSACFEYIEELGQSLYHFKCSHCNSLIHVHCLLIDQVKGHLLEEHGFEIDDSKLVFVGQCQNCRKNRGKEE